MNEEQKEAIELAYEAEMDEWAELETKVDNAIRRSAKYREYDDPLQAEAEIQGLQAKALGNIHRVLTEILKRMETKE